MFSREHMLNVVEMARTALAELDLKERAARCGLRVEGDAVCGDSLGDKFSVPLSGGDPERDPMRLLFEGVVLHHLATAEDTAMDGEYVSLFDMPEFRTYLPTLKKRIERPLVMAFGDGSTLLGRAVEACDGTVRRMAGPAGMVWFLPRVPITVSVCEGDEELPPTATVLFDASVRRLLPNEDIILAAEMTAHKLKYIAGKLKRNEEAENNKNIAD